MLDTPYIPRLPQVRLRTQPPGVRGHMDAVGWSPLALPGLVVWPRGPAIVGLNSGDPIISFTDSKGVAWGQTTPSKCPTWIASGQNGLPVMRAATDDFLDSAGFSLAQPMFWFLAGSTSAPTGLAAWMSSIDSAVGHQMEVYNQTTLYKMFAGTILASTTAPDANFHTLIAEFNGATSALWLDGTQIKSGNAGTGDITLGMRLFGSWSGLNLTGDIGEAGAASGTLDAATRTSLQAYLKSTWATP